MPGPNFDLVSELQLLSRRDFPMADPTLLQPLNANPLVDGEWLEMNSSYQLARGASGAGIHEGLVPSFPVHTERGRYDTQAIGKANVFLFGMYEVDTVVCNIAGLSIGSMLTVQDVTFQSLTRRGVGVKTGALMVVVGFVTKLYGSTVKVRMAHFGYNVQP